MCVASPSGCLYLHASYHRVKAELWKVEPPSTFTIPVGSWLSGCFYRRSLFQWPQCRLRLHPMFPKISVHSSSLVPDSHSGRLASLETAFPVWSSQFRTPAVGCNLHTENSSQVDTQQQEWPSVLLVTPLKILRPVVSLCPPSSGHSSR